MTKKNKDFLEHVTSGIRHWRKMGIDGMLISLAAFTVVCCIVTLLLELILWFLGLAPVLFGLIGFVLMLGFIDKLEGFPSQQKNE